MSWELERRRHLLAAVCATVAYADIFDCAVAGWELHRDLIFVDSSPFETHGAAELAVSSGLLSGSAGYLSLPDRTHLAELRRRREKRSAELWPTAWHYSQLLAAIPFVRMVGVTGSLAANNPVDDADVDFMLVSTSRRLWLVRAAAVAVVRLARQRSVILCPNYLLSTRALELAERDLYTAHELLQLVPTSGRDVYRELIARNGWIGRFMPNRAREPRPVPRVAPLARVARAAGEFALAGPIGDSLNDWEERRKVSRFRVVDASATFNDDVCEGHFRRHRQLVLDAFVDRATRLGVDVALLEAAAPAGPSASLTPRLEVVR